VTDAFKELELEWRPEDARHGVVSLIFKYKDAKFVDRIPIMKADRRATAVRRVCGKWPEIDTPEWRAEITLRLETTAENAISYWQQQAEKEEDRHNGSPTDVLVRIAEACELFHTPKSQNQEAFATITVDEHDEHWPVRSRGFRCWLQAKYYETRRTAASSKAVQDALNVIEARARVEGAEHEVELRLAKYGSSIWLDLCDEEWRAVEVTPDGWRIVPSEEVPVRFTRRGGMLEIPEPIRGGSVEELRALVNLPDDDAFILLVGWLIGVLSPSGPYPVLAVDGEQGSAKSSLCRYARAILDPNSAPLRRPVRNERDLAIAANNSGIIAFDNLSGIRPWLSDALCSLATGGGFSTRRLYSDAEETLFYVCRPIMLNGIGDVATRPDLLDRSVHLRLLPIADHQRRDEVELNRQFEEARPRILGALLDAASAAMRNRATVKLDKRPRMADFAIWVTAAESALGWQPGRFLAAYERNRAESHLAVVESSPIGPAILDHLGPRLRKCSGTAATLLEKLGRVSSEETRRRRDWPQTPRGFRAALDRIAPSLKAVGIEVAYEKTTSSDRTRLIFLRDRRPRSSPPSSPSDKMSKRRVIRRRVKRAKPAQSRQRPKGPDSASLERPPSDGSDGSDG